MPDQPETPPSVTALEAERAVRVKVGKVDTHKPAASGDGPYRRTR